MTDEKKKLPAIRLQDGLVIRNSQGDAVRYDSMLTLSSKDETLVKMGNMTEKVPQEDGSVIERPLFLVTAKGWARIGAQCGVRIAAPKSVIVNDREQPNGYQDPETGKIWFRSIAFGNTAMGQVAWSSRTVSYDPHLANVADLLAKAKAKWNNGFFEIGPFEGKNEHGMLLGSPPATKEGKKWLGYRIDEASVLWVRTDAPDIFKWQGEMVNRVEKALRTCQTFADRNALAAHPATPTQAKFHAAVGQVKCSFWIGREGKQLTIDQGQVIDVDVEKLLEQADAEKVEDAEPEDLNKTTSVEEVDAIEVVAQGDVRDVRTPAEDLFDGTEEDSAEPPEPVAGPKTPTTEMKKSDLIDEAEELEEEVSEGLIGKARNAAGIGVTEPLKSQTKDALASLVSLYRAAQK